MVAGGQILVQGKSGLLCKLREIKEHGESTLQDSNCRPNPHRLLPMNRRSTGDLSFTQLVHMADVPTMRDVWMGESLAQ